MDIYSILKSKPHNPHYLNRYISFIQRCQLKNVGYDGITENHHMCPKSIFPEYKILKKNIWNMVKLTPRQHFVAHIILDRVFYCEKMKQSLFFMMNGRWGIYNNCSKRCDRLKMELSEFLTSTVVVNNKDGTYNRICKEEFIKGDYEGTTKGMVSAIKPDGTCIMISKEEFEKRDDLHGVALGHVPCKDEMGNTFSLPKEEFYSRNDVFSIFRGRVFRTDRMGNKLYITTDEFHSRDDIHHHRKNMVTCKDKDGNKYHVPIEEFRARDDLISYRKGKVSCLDRNGNKVHVTKEEFKSRDDLISLSKLRFLNKIKCVNKTTGKFIWLTEEELRNREHYVERFIDYDENKSIKQKKSL